MDTRHLIWIGVLVGGTIGGWIPTLWGAGAFSITGIVGSTIGGLLGIYVGMKIAEW
ncbi:MAG: hypothetical protein RL536_154 [Candidatus Parcubacteria bacterium]|jgi:hypothetical protein